MHFRFKAQGPNILKSCLIKSDLHETEANKVFRQLLIPFRIEGAVWNGSKLLQFKKKQQQMEWINEERRDRYIDRETCAQEYGVVWSRLVKRASGRSQDSGTVAGEVHLQFQVIKFLTRKNVVVSRPALSTSSVLPTPSPPPRSATQRISH